MAKRDYYEVLEVTKVSTEIEIKKSYRVLAKKYHPDLNPGNAEAEALFKECSEAYQVLSDPEKRAIYDQYGHAGLENRGFHGFSGAEEIFSNFGDLFDSFFGFGGGRRRRDPNAPQAGADLQTEVLIDLRDALTGVQKEIELEKDNECAECGGHGSEAGHPPETCPTCKGHGQVMQSRGFMSIATTCPKCRGKGKVVTHPCKNCRGQGRVAEKKRIQIDVPAGIEHGMQMRVMGAGEGGHRGGPAGNLYVVVGVREHPKFERQGEHLLGNLSITMAQAALGASIDVETLDGKTIAIDVARGTQNGERLEVAGEGLPKVNRKQRGNLYLDVQVAIPKRLTKRQEELLAEFAKEAGESVKPGKGFFKKK